MENEIKQLLLNINQNVYKYMELVNSMQTNIFNQLNDIRNLVITSNNSILSLEERIKNIESVHLSTSTTDNINNIKQQVAENNQLLLEKINNMNELINKVLNAKQIKNDFQSITPKPPIKSYENDEEWCECKKK